MGRAERMQLIKKLEELTNSKVLVYITGDRRGLETKVSPDIFPFVFKHLKKFGATEKISLFLYTPGGVTISGFGLVNLIREFCNKFDVLIPFRALSTGTLIALGANQIIMSRLGQLGPVDPSVNHPLAPTTFHPQNPAAKVLVPVNVEDIISFFELAKNEACANSEKELTEAFRTLSTNVHPIVLGAINRARHQIKFLAKTLLSYHSNDIKKNEHIVSTLLEQRFSHDYLVGRKEAKEVIKLNIVDVSDEIDDNMQKLYDEYYDLMQLGSAYNPEEILGQNNNIDATFYRGIIESEDLSHPFTTIRNIQRVQVPTPAGTKTGFSELVREEGWMENNTI